MNDAELVALARQGDTGAFGELVGRHRAAVYRAALAALGSHAEAEDAAQDAFVTAYKRLSSFRGEANFKTWLLTIAWHHSINRRRWPRLAWRRRDGREGSEGLPRALEEERERTPEQLAIRFRAEAAVLRGAARPRARRVLPDARRCRAQDVRRILDGLWFFQLYVWKAARPREMLSIARAVLQYKASPPDAQYLESVLQWIFAHSVTDARAFAASGIDLVGGISDLDAYDVAQQVSGGTLLRAFRRYLISHLTGPRCSDSQTEPGAIDLFNRLVSRRAAGVADLKPIAGNEARPSGVLGRARLDWMWQTSESRRLRGEAAALYGDGRRPHTEAVKNGREWQDRARRFVEDLERWDGAHEPNDRDYYYEKSALLTGLLEIAPAGAIKARALSDFVAFLKRTTGRQPPSAWYAHVTRLIDLARSRDRESILRALEESEEPALTIYARLERMRVQDVRRADQ